MITDLEVTNFRSLGHVKLALGRMCVFVGPNGSGKSNVLDVLSFVSEAVRQGLSAAVTHRHGIDAVRRRSGGHPYNVRIALRIRLADGDAQYGFEIAGDRTEEYRVKEEWVAFSGAGQADSGFRRVGAQWHGPSGLAPRLEAESLALTSLAGDTRYAPLAHFLADLTVYSIFPDTLREPQKFDSERPMKRHGENWVSVLRDLAKSKAKADLLAALRKLTGDIEDIRVGKAGGYIVAEFKQTVVGSKSKRWFGASQQSDGTLRVAGLLTALLQSTRPSVMGVEEPELTVHPGVIAMVYEHLAEASDQTQILMTTHSPVLLDVVDLERASLFAVERRDGETRVERVADTNLAPARDRLLSLGELMISGDLQMSLLGDAAV